MTPRSILAVTDFSQQGGHALARAALLCAEHRAPLTLVYLAHPGEVPLPDTAVRLSHHALQLRQRHDIHVHAAARIDSTVADVAREAAGADLVVWGTAPVRGLRAWFGTHPAIQMLRTCQRPVIVVRNPADQPCRSLMVAVDFSQVSHRLVELGLALHPSARVELFHAISTANEGKLRYAEVSERAIQIYQEQCRRHAQDRMFTLTDSYDARRNRLSSSIGRGDPARQVLVAQQNTAADLIVVGKHPASALSDLMFESVAQRILRDARTDVLVVPHGFQPASRGSAVKRLATDLPVRRVKAGAPRPPSHPNPAAHREPLHLFTNSPAPPLP
ncbi:universal stress protein UspA [Acidovorax sp. Root275]|uniref:universal stress protein n=1 Tax=Acidovorax sp. Root275 TaxID=1736508 RepID=UPI00070F4379|nr:universal stress protein [Acidovorax sp. Root275]KRD55340.1 universal stress protein UspA [Acidovorax sp. Root275]